MLVLNDSKTEVIHLSTMCCGQGSVPPWSIRVDGVCISPSNAVRNLEVNIDLARTMSTHVSTLCKFASFVLWKISWITTLLDQSTTLRLILAFVTFRMDYCCSLLFCLPRHEIRKMQIIENSWSCLDSKTRNCDHMTTILHGLFCLPVH